MPFGKNGLIIYFNFDKLLVETKFDGIGKAICQITLIPRLYLHIKSGKIILKCVLT